MNWKVIAKCLTLSKEFNQSTNIETNHFSFLIRRNNIKAIGWNNIAKTHPIAMKLNYKWPTIHSELACILNFGKDCKDHYMVNIRYMKDGSLGLSKPCKYCQVLLSKYNINNVIYSTEYGFSFFEKEII